MSSRFHTPLLVAAVLAAGSAGPAPAARAGTIPVTDAGRSVCAPDEGGFDAIDCADDAGSATRSFGRDADESLRLGTDTGCEWTSQPADGVPEVAPEERTPWLGAASPGGRLADYGRIESGVGADVSSRLRRAMANVDRAIRTARPKSADDVRAEHWVSLATTLPVAEPSDRFRKAADASAPADATQTRNVMILVPVPPPIWTGLALMAAIGVLRAVRRSRRPDPI